MINRILRFNLNASLMKKIVLLLFTVLVSIACFAQQTNNKADSVENILKNHKKEDTTKIQLLNKLSNHYASVDPKNCLLYTSRCV